jgi:hypothetical protein
MFCAELPDTGISGFSGFSQTPPARGACDFDKRNPCLRSKAPRDLDEEAKVFGDGVGRAPGGKVIRARKEHHLPRAMRRNDFLSVER